jgi:non-ribosomal peptide synthetase component F
MLQQFDDVLKQLLATPTTPFLQLSSAVRPNLQSAMNTEPRRIPLELGTLIHHGFESNARERPSALALWFKPNPADPAMDIRWTYDELNCRANRLSHLLLALYGHFTDEVIPLCMDKSCELYVSLLGVVKVGETLHVE